jgi:hypothetical protein
VKLRLEPVAAPEAAIAVVKPPPRGWSPGPAVGMFGLAAAGIGVGTVFGIIAVGNKSDLDLACPNRGCPPSAEPQITTLKRNAVVSTIGFLVGAAGMVGGVGYLLLAPGRTESGRVHPFIGPGLAGVVGSFW